MHLSKLSLTNFRNYQRLEWEPDRGINILFGDNGQGKTNLVEAINFLSTTRSYRTSIEKELINWSASHDDISAARVEGEVVGKKGKLRLELALMGRKSDSGKTSSLVKPEVDALVGVVHKKILLNGVPRRAMDVVGKVNTVLFASHDIDVSSGAPSQRRRYLDVMESQVNVEYLRALAGYNRILVQRNHLLRQIQEGHANSFQLEFWNNELVEKGSYLVEQRMALIGNICALAADIHRQLTSEKENLIVLYLPSLKEVTADMDRVSIKGNFSTRLELLQKREVAAGMSLVGPHRDDLTFLVNGVDIGIYGSRGQQRTVALSLKLAEAGFLRQTVGESPVVLLDDILSELDSKRRHLVIETLRAYGQVVTTTTELESLEAAFVAGAKVFRVHEGTLTPA
ncbi:MAG: DNA replication/repair protein RecF [Dehalococcoidia bacterium]|nr:DNA replication/repair protein RecF [Dehalococcoidia bacterium]